MLETFESQFGGRSSSSQKFKDRDTGKLVRLYGVRDSSSNGDGEERDVGGGEGGGVADGKAKRASCLANQVMHTVRYIVIIDKDSSEASAQ